MTTTLTASQRKRKARTNRTNGGTAYTFDFEQRTAVLYARRSAFAGTRETNNEVQLTEGREWCERNNVRIVREFSEVGESAFDGKSPRGDFKDALEMIHDGSANTLVVFKLDRFMRNAGDAIRVRDDCHKSQGSVVATKESLDTARNDGATRMQFNMLATVAEIESQNKRDHINAFHRRRYEAGAIPGGKAPYGYRRKGSTFVIVENEAEVIRGAARQLLAEGNSLGLAKRLGWDRSTLRYRLTSETYAGLRFDGTKHVAGNWPAILAREVWQACLDIYADPSRVMPGDKNGNGPAARRHLLAGLMVCAKHPTARMRTVSHPRGPRYQCNTQGCYNGIDIAIADGTLNRWVLSNITREVWDRMRASGRGHAASVIADAEERMINTLRLRDAKRITDAVCDRMLDEINEQLANAQTGPRLELPAVEDLASAWEDMNVAARQLVIHAAATVVLNEYEPGTSRTKPAYERIDIDGKKI